MINHEFLDTDEMPGCIVQHSQFVVLVTHKKNWGHRINDLLESLKSLTATGNLENKNHINMND